MAMKKEVLLNYLELKGTVVHNECYISRPDRKFLWNHNYQGQEINSTSCASSWVSKHPLLWYVFNLLYFRQHTSWSNFLSSSCSPNSCPLCTLQRVSLFILPLVIRSSLALIFTKFCLWPSVDDATKMWISLYTSMNKLVLPYLLPQ